MKPLIIFYDEPCVLCNYWVQKLCHWDKKDQLRFSSLDSALFLGFAKERELDLNQIDSIVVWDQQYSFALEAEGVFMVLKQLGGAWRLLLPFSFLPKTLTNGLYRIIAKNRYRWFGKHKHCPLPDARYQHKFVH
ncbi:MAG: DCC1-like thiol-disulfide oxidoreductase family protein [Candidatus Arcticimaribacter sp.]